MTTRTSHGQQLRRGGAPEPIEHVGALEMRVEAGRLTAQAAERWAQRADTLASWLAAEWQTEWISLRPGGRGCVAVTVPPNGLETGTEAMVIQL